MEDFRGARGAAEFSSSKAAASIARVITTRTLFFPSLASLSTITTITTTSA